MKNMASTLGRKGGNSPSLPSKIDHKIYDDITSYHEIIGYLVALRRSGYVKDESFAALVSYATANFIEAELDRKISHIFDTKFTPDKLLKYL